MPVSLKPALKIYSPMGRPVAQPTSSISAPWGILSQSQAISGSAKNLLFFLRSSQKTLLFSYIEIISELFGSVTLYISFSEDCRLILNILIAGHVYRFTCPATFILISAVAIRGIIINFHIPMDCLGPQSIQDYYYSNHPAFALIPMQRNKTLDQIAHYQFEVISGDRNKDIPTYVLELVKENCGDSNLSCAILGCQEILGPEKVLMESGLFSEIHIYDYSKNLIEKQRELTKNLGIKGIEFHTVDLNDHEFESNQFDLVFGWGTVHHISNLDHLYSQIKKSLKPNGLFVMREYAEPNRIQLTKKQMDIVNSLLAVIPKKYRISPDGKLIKCQKISKEKYVIATDPSESIRSEDVIPRLLHHFKNAEVKLTGGTILQPLLANIAGNFEADDEGKEILLSLIAIEKALISSKIIPSDFIFSIAKN
jgi:SAM-dependent methyltransferase